MFCLYTCISLLVAFVSFFIMPETKGMSLEDIEKMYRAKE